jgi:hypothetical protein
MRLKACWVGIGILICMLPACRFQSHNLISCPVTLGRAPFIVNPVEPLAATGHFTDLEISIPQNLTLDPETMSVLKRDGSKIQIGATLTTSEGNVHHFNQVDFGKRNGRHYVKLHSGIGITFDPTIRYIQIAITSSEPITIDEIRWRSNDR